VDAFPKVEFQRSHADLGLFTPGSAAASLIEETLPRLTPDDLGEATGMRVFLWKQGPFARPLFRIPREQSFAYIVTLRAETTDQNAVARMLKGNRALFEANRDLGGTHYPFSALELSHRDWQEHYGVRWSALADAKRRYDPDSVLASGPDLFGPHRS
jgi:cytokinin dehydrogenase